MSEYSRDGKRNQNVKVPDFRKETNREYAYSNRPYQRDYLKGTEWEKKERTGEQNRSGKESASAQQKRSTGSGRERTRATQSRSATGAGSRVKKNSLGNERQKRRRRRKRKKKLVGWGFAAMCVLGILAGGLLGRTKAQMNDILNQKTASSIDLNEVTIDESKLDSDSEIRNILLVGADKRESWSEAGRSDCVMVATIDKKHKCLKLTSLMRDMYIDIPNHGKDKFNAAYSYGGIELLYKTIAYNFDLKLDGYALVDFAAFQKAVNKIGGVDVELTEAEANYLRTAYHRGSVLKVQSGLHTLNGAQALAYVRIRQDRQADFGRTARQRKVMQAIFTKAKTKSYSQLLDMAKTVMPNITTDLDNDEIYGILTDIIRMGTTNIEQQRIPVDNSYQSERINNQLVLVPDLDVNKQKLQEFIFTYGGEAESSTQPDQTAKAE